VLFIAIFKYSPAHQVLLLWSGAIFETKYEVLL